jgi:hypothetical protein
MKRKHVGSKFEEFLAADGILEECRASAIKSKTAHELARIVSERKPSKPGSTKQLKMRTSLGH